MTSKTRWYCSKKANGCKAKVITTENGQFVDAIYDHTHPAPFLFRTPDGKVFRV